jgi:uncharacterized protein YjiS (DUF1127 family)
VPEDCGIDRSEWEALTPAQQSAASWPLVRRAHAEFQRAGIRRFRHGIIEAVAAIWMRYRRHRQRRQDLAALAAMDDHSLQDMGLSRTEVRGAIRLGTDLTSVRR